MALQMSCDHNINELVVASSSISLYKCDICGLIFDKKYIEKFNTAYLYTDYYGNEISKIGRFVFGIENLIKLFRFFRALKIFTICPKAKKYSI